jgi:hypothetical protein
MAEFKINRPSVRITSNIAKTRHSYIVTASTWKQEYTRAEWVESTDEAKQLAKNFLKFFEASAKRVESSGNRASIMKNLVLNGKFTEKEKLMDEFANADF